MKMQRVLFAILAALAADASLSSSAAAVNAIYNSATDVPVTADGYTAAGNTVAFTLNFAPTIGTELMVVKNTSVNFIDGHFSNLAQGQAVRLTYQGVPYHFVANYYGGSGNDLVLLWAETRVFAFGYNAYGQLGDGTTTDRWSPVPVKGALLGKTVIAVAAGDSHSLALCSDGTVAAWGRNGEGQLGDGTTIYRSIPVAVSTNSALSNKTVVAIAAGHAHSLALCSDGTLVAWGFNGDGELGNGTLSDSYLPVAVDNISFSSALSNKTVIAFSVGYTHNVAACSDGSLAAWGYNAYGELGHGTQSQTEPVPLAVITTGTPLEGKTVVSLASGFQHSLALCSDGTLAAWCGTGAGNGEGQVGNGTEWTAAFFPTAVSTNSALSNKTVVALAASANSSLALCSDGTLAIWGDKYAGELGIPDPYGYPSYVPTTVPAGGTILEGKTVVSIAEAGDTRWTLSADGTLAGWGSNGYGQLGVGHNSNGGELEPLAVVTTTIRALGDGARFIGVSRGDSGASHTLALVASSTAPDVVGINSDNGRAVTVTYAGVSGFDYDIEASTNLADWGLVSTQPAGTNGLFQFTDSDTASYPKRFFRSHAH